MNEFLVKWETGQLEMKTHEGALILKQSFLEEGQQAKAYGRSSPATEWMEIA